MTDNRPGNWLAVQRDMLDHPVVGAGRPLKAANPKVPAYDRYAAWSDILRLVQYRPGEVNNKGAVQQLAVGEMMAARAFLAARWRATEKSVRVFLDDLERHGMISRRVPVASNQGQQSGQRRANKCCILTVCNYGTYQQVGGQPAAHSRHASGPANGHRGASQGPESNTANTETRKKESLCGGTAQTTASNRQLAEEQFEAFWKAFPSGRKRDKGDCRDLFCAIVLGQHRKRRATAEAIIDAARRYAASAPDPEFVPMPATWLSGGRWEDDTHGPRGTSALTAERQSELADKAIAAQTWPAAYKAGPHSPDSLFTDPDVRQKLLAHFDPANQFIGPRTRFNGQAATHAPTGGLNS